MELPSRAGLHNAPAPCWDFVGARHTVRSTMGSRLEQKSSLVRKRIENHIFSNEEGEEYEGSKFGGFPEYFRRKKIKLQNLDAQLRAQSTDKPQIFRGVVCHVNGYTQPSLNDLHAMIVQHGGGFIQYLDGKTMVTHIIASNLTPKKKEEFRRYRIVKPAWIVDSIKAGKLLPWDAYRVVDEGVGQKVLGFNNGTMVSQAAMQTRGYREQTETSWYASQLRAGRSSSPQGRSNFMQIATPVDEIEDAAFHAPEITSSIEKALAEADDVDGDDKIDDRPAEGHEDEMEIRKTSETPSPSGPGPQPFESGPQTSVDNHDEVAINATESRELRPREGSQEPDYSMAVIRDSEALRSISPGRLATMTAEEHNALLLSDPRIRKSTVVHPDFLEQYYRESRLHHLSTWKAELKSQLQALTAAKVSSQKQKVKKAPGQRRYIMHVDFDSFFAAVSLKKHPQYADEPCVVAHGQGSGSEIASCNYPARKYGISNGMWMRRAQELCPELKILPYDFPGYEAASRKFYDAIMATGGIVQSVSIDEALVDISALCFAASGTDGVKRNEGAVFREQNKADEIAQELRDEVLAKTGCNVSVGIGGNILLAKIALRKAKPAGQYQLRPEEVLDFIGELEVTKLPGVAWATGGKLEDIGVKFVKDIRELTKERLINALGPKTGEKLWEYSRGIDRLEVGEQVVRKSVSAEVNWGVRFENQDQVDEFMLGLAGELNKRLLKEKVKGKQLNLKVMRRAADAPRDPPKHLGHGKCDTFNKSVQLGVATNDTDVIAKKTMAMMRSLGISPGELRGIGVQMQKLEPLKSVEGSELGSQRRLPFMVGGPAKLPVAARSKTEDDIQDDGTSPQRLPAGEPTNEAEATIGVQIANQNTPSKQPLNMLGTQFVLPTQVDPSVLAELPSDIRERLAQHVKPLTPAAPSGFEQQDEPPLSKNRNEATTEPPSRAPSPPSRAPSPAVTLPNQSQLDPSILEALPDDVRAELLDYYTKGTGARRRGEQALLPQSPRKLRVLPPAKHAPIKRKRGGGLFAGRARSTLNGGGGSSTLTQANFVARPAPRHTDEGGITGTDTEAEGEVDPEFLAALPEDVRREVLEQQRNARLQRTGGIDLSLHQRPRAARKKKQEVEDGPLDRILTLPPRPPKPTFTTRKLSELPDLRQAVKAWVQEFSDEGPYDEDIAALVKYLRDVVIDERDVGKAAAVADWMAWVIDQCQEYEAGIKEAWERGLERVRKGVQDAANERGVVGLCFDF